MTVDAAALLHARMIELTAILRKLDADEGSLRADRADGTADDEHDPEGSTLSGEWQRVDALRRSVVAEQREVAAALERVDAGEYGRCIRCGVVIPDARMTARPMATHCVRCAV